MVVDIHAHVGPTPKDSRSAHAFGSHPAATAEDYIEAMTRAGVQVGVTFGCLDLDNEYQSLIQKRYPDRIRSFAWINPRRPDAATQLERCIERLGLCGVKLHGWWHQFSYSDHVLLDPLCQICQERDLPMLVHVAGDNPLTSPLQLEEMARSFPQATFIMAHGGAPWLYDEALMVVRRTRNIVVDTTGMCGFWITRMVEEIGPDRVAMGSDYPWNYLEPTIRGIEVAVRNEDARDWVLGKTAARVLGLGPNA
jgi:predicted TIM-barrel fold metal-dependent hydrolase